MAFMSQENKAVLAKEIAKVMPKGWKYTLRVHHHSTLILTIRQANTDLIGSNLIVQKQMAAFGRPEYRDINEYHLHTEFEGKLLKTFQSIKGAMMVGNHDRSELQSDYFDVGWYIDIKIGDFHSPFRFVPKRKAKTLRNPMHNHDAFRASLGAPDTTTPRPKGMPEDLTHAQEITWMKNRIIQLEGHA